MSKSNTFKSYLIPSFVRGVVSGILSSVIIFMLIFLLPSIFMIYAIVFGAVLGILLGLACGILLIINHILVTKKYIPARFRIWTGVIVSTVFTGFATAWAMRTVLGIYNVSVLDNMSYAIMVSTIIGMLAACLNSFQILISIEKPKPKT